MTQKELICPLRKQIKSTLQNCCSNVSLLAGLSGNESGCDSLQILDNNENSGSNETADEMSRWYDVTHWQWKNIETYQEKGTFFIKRKSWKNPISKQKTRNIFQMFEIDSHAWSSASLKSSIFPGAPLLWPCATLSQLLNIHTEYFRVLALHAELTNNEALTYKIQNLLYHLFPLSADLRAGK